MGRKINEAPSTQITAFQTDDLIYIARPSGLSDHYMKAQHLSAIAPLEGDLQYYSGGQWLKTNGQLAWDGSQLTIGGVPVTKSDELVGQNPVSNELENPTIAEDGYVITWDNTAGQFDLTPLLESISLDQLSDVDLTGIVDHDLLYWDGVAGQWKPSAGAASWDGAKMTIGSVTAPTAKLSIRQASDAIDAGIEILSAGNEARGGYLWADDLDFRIEAKQVSGAVEISGGGNSLLRVSNNSTTTSTLNTYWQVSPEGVLGYRIDEVDATFYEDDGATIIMQINRDADSNIEVFDTLGAVMLSIERDTGDMYFTSGGSESFYIGNPALTESRLYSTSNSNLLIYAKYGNTGSLELIGQRDVEIRNVNSLGSGITIDFQNALLYEYQNTSIGSMGRYGQTYTPIAWPDEEDTGRKFWNTRVDIKAQSNAPIADPSATGIYLEFYTSDGVTVRDSTAPVDFIRFSEDVNTVVTDKFRVDLSGNTTMGRILTIQDQDNGVGASAFRGYILSTASGSTESWMLGIDGSNQPLTLRFEGNDVMTVDRFGADRVTFPTAPSVEFFGDESTNPFGSSVAGDGVLRLNDATTLPSGTLGSGGLVYVDPADGLLYFFDDVGNVYDLTGSVSGVQKTGTPVNNQLAVWTDSNTIEGEANVQYDAGVFKLVQGTLTFGDTAEANSTMTIQTESTASDTSIRIQPKGNGVITLGGTTAWNFGYSTDIGATRSLRAIGSPATINFEFQGKGTLRTYYFGNNTTNRERVYVRSTSTNAQGSQVVVTNGDSTSGGSVFTASTHATGGDPYLELSVGVSHAYSLGIDNTDDLLKINYAASSSVDPSSGTTLMEIDGANQTFEWVGTGDFNITGGGDFYYEGGVFEITRASNSAYLRLSRDDTVVTSGETIAVLYGASKDTGTGAGGLKDVAGFQWVATENHDANTGTRIDVRITPAGSNTVVTTMQLTNDLIVLDGHGYFKRNGSAGLLHLIRDSAVSSGNNLGRLLFGGDDDAGEVYQAEIRGVATEDWTATAGGTEMEFYTTDNTTLTLDLRATIAHDGGFFMQGASGGSYGSGTINATEVRDDGSVLTDFVLEKYWTGETIDKKWKDYVMMSLEDAISFTKEKLHLPWMTGRQEWEKRKPSLGVLSHQLTETSETLFLYIKQLNDRINKLEQQLLKN